VVSNKLFFILLNNPFLYFTWRSTRSIRHQAFRSSEKSDRYNSIAEYH